nr:LysR family transcriptional regulator [Nocardia bovistercoris]
MLHILLAVAATESLRQAARTVHMHHNSVTHRVQRAERALGFSCTKPYGRTRLMFVLTLHRILDSWRHF